MDQELSDAAAYTPVRHLSPDCSTFLCKMTAWLPSWKS